MLLPAIAVPVTLEVKDQCEKILKKTRISLQLESKCIRSAAEVRSLLGHQEVLSPFFGLRTDCSPMRYLAMYTFKLLVTMHEQWNTQCSKVVALFQVDLEVVGDDREVKISIDDFILNNWMVEKDQWVPI